MKPRLVFVALVAVFLLPFLLAWWLNFGPWPWRPAAAGNRGILIQPPVAVEQAGVRSLVPAAGENALADDAFRGHWSLVYAGDGACAEGCEKALTRMRQSWLALGKDARRVQRWFLLTGEKLPSASLLESHPGLAVVVSDSSRSAASGTLEAALVAARESLGDSRVNGNGEMEDVLWLLDPGGFVILAYGPAASATDLLRDMQRLLKYSAQDR